MTENYLPISGKTLARSGLADRLTPDLLKAVDVVGSVLPFRTNGYVVSQLIDWARVPDDPIFRLNFPQPEMLNGTHYAQMEQALGTGDPETIARVANDIRSELNPHPAGQLDHNMVEFRGQGVAGLQQKYKETLLFFPRDGQTCHAYCTFCFRWPQFVGDPKLRMANGDGELLADYIRAHPQITDVLITGGDPMIMRSPVLGKYLEPLMGDNTPNLKNVRIGSKTLTYWPFRYSTDSDSAEVLDLFRRVNKSGKQLHFMAHINHPNEMSTPAFHKAVQAIKETGTLIRTQSPLLRNINDDPDIWARMWREQVNLGMIPYYMFVVRDTGAQNYFSVPLVEAQQIYADAIRQVSGLARTARGPVMSCDPGKVQVLGTARVSGEDVIALTMLQGRSPGWVGKPFFAKYDPGAIWMSELRPAFGEQEFFFDRELQTIYETR